MRKRKIFYQVTISQAPQLESERSTDEERQMPLLLSCPVTRWIVGVAHGIALVEARIEVENARRVVPQAHEINGEPRRGDIAHRLLTLVMLTTSDGGTNYANL